MARAPVISLQELEKTAKACPTSTVKTLSDHRKILFLILSEFKRIIQLQLNDLTSGGIEVN